MRCSIFFNSSISSFDQKETDISTFFAKKKKIKPGGNDEYFDVVAKEKILKPSRVEQTAITYYLEHGKL